jgi:hypothetical protein
MQLPFCTIRSESNPDRLYWAQEGGRVWRSDNNGQNRRCPACAGLHVLGGLSVQCDPKNDTIA